MVTRALRARAAAIAAPGVRYHGSHVKRILVRTKPRSYPVHIECGLLARAGEIVRGLLPNQRSQCFVVTAEPVRRNWGAVLAQSLERSRVAHHWLETADGESHKTLAAVERMAARMVELGADRGSVVIGFGGGVAGDMAGLLASLYMRGVALVQAPTTLLAQVDAAIGGKTGVNLKAGKNLLGTLHQPLAVITDPAVLATLPEREFRAGLFEAIKCGVVRSPKLFAFLEANRELVLARDMKALAWVIAECAKVKADIVAKDVAEAGLRRTLNLGHTVGHALEAETRYKQFLHGEAVGWGMVAAAMIGAGTGKTPPDAARRIISAVLAYSPLPPVDARPAALLARLRSDKKTRNGLPHFVLPRGIGRVEVTSAVSEEAILQALERMRSLSRH
jgi:3-dehydroquinate synthase